MRAEWQAEKDAIERVRNLRQLIEETRAEVERAQRDRRPAAGGRAHLRRPARLERELEEAMARLEELQSQPPLLKEEVGAERHRRGGRRAGPASR